MVIATVSEGSPRSGGHGWGGDDPPHIDAGGVGWQLFGVEQEVVGWLFGSGKPRGCEHCHGGGGGKKMQDLHLLHELWMLVVPPSALAVILHHQGPAALQGSRSVEVCPPRLKCCSGF